MKTSFRRAAIVASLSALGVGATACLGDEADTFEGSDREPHRARPPLEVTEEQVPPPALEPYCPPESPHGYGFAPGFGDAARRAAEKEAKRETAPGCDSLSVGCDYFEPECEDLIDGWHCWVCAHPHSPYDLDQPPPCDAGFQQRTNWHPLDSNRPFERLWDAHVAACAALDCQEGIPVCAPPEQTAPDAHLDVWGWWRADLCVREECVIPLCDLDGTCEGGETHGNCPSDCAPVEPAPDESCDRDGDGEITDAECLLYCNCDIHNEE